jgi:hypothetical protein
MGVCPAVMSLRILIGSILAKGLDRGFGRLDLNN